jgi:hypothetical protein
MSFNEKQLKTPAKTSFDAVTEIRIVTVRDVPVHRSPCFHRNKYCPIQTGFFLSVLNCYDVIFVHLQQFSVITITNCMTQRGPHS